MEGDGWVKDWYRKAAKEQGSQVASPGSTGMHRLALLGAHLPLHTALPCPQGTQREAKGLEVTRLVETFGSSMLSSAKPRSSLLLQPKGRHPPSPSHGSFTTGQRQLYPVKLWPLPCRTRTAPAAFHWGHSSDLPDGPRSLVVFVYSAQPPQGPKICVKLYTPHMQTVQTREQHRFDTESLYNGISQCPVHPGGSSCLPQGEFSILVHCCL